MMLRPLLKRLPIERFRSPPPVVAVIALTGLIGRFGPWRQGLSLGTLAGVIERAFGIADVKAVALLVNSPGGAPVQAALIAKRIRALAEEKKVPVVAFAEDVAASGGYWLLTAGDEIFADDSSIIGSIGVISAGFGFPELLRRIGVERRVHTSGDHKGALDPFRPEEPEDVEHLRAIQAEIHEAFRQQVRSRRQGRLKADDDELFSGRFWSGRRALELGLIDGLGDVRTVMRKRYGNKVRLVPIADGRSWWRRRLGVPGLTGRGSALEEAAFAVADALEQRLSWSRYGL
jgi:signal peptide peptidase SppA